MGEYIGSDTHSGSVFRPLATINAAFGNSAQYPLKLNIRGVFTALQTLTYTYANTQITTTDGWECRPNVSPIVNTPEWAQDLRPYLLIAQRGVSHF